MSEQSVEKNAPVFDNIHDTKAAMRKRVMEKYQKVLHSTKKYQDLLEVQRKEEEYKKLLAETGAIGFSDDEIKVQKASKEFEEEMRKIDQFNPELEEHDKLAKEVLGDDYTKYSREKSKLVSAPKPGATVSNALAAKLAKAKKLPDEE